MCNIKRSKYPTGTATVWILRSTQCKVRSQNDSRQRRGSLLCTSRMAITNNSEPSSEHTSNYHNVRLTIGEGSNSSRWDSSIDTPEAPCLVEALLTLQSCLNGVQGEEGQIHTHPCRASCLDRRISLCEMQYTLYNSRNRRHGVPMNNSEKYRPLNAPLRLPARC